MIAFFNAGMPSAGVYFTSPVFSWFTAVDDGVDGRLALRLAAAEVDDGLALLAQQGRGLVQLQGGRLAD